MSRYSIKHILYSALYTAIVHIVKDDKFKKTTMNGKTSRFVQTSNHSNIVGPTVFDDDGWKFWMLA